MASLVRWVRLANRCVPRDKACDREQAHERDKIRRHLRRRGFDRNGARRRRQVSRCPAAATPSTPRSISPVPASMPAFATAVGDDPYSDSVVALAAAEGVSSDLILRVPGRLPALCLVENGPGGERAVRTWREGAPASELFELPDWMRVAESLTNGAADLFLRHHAVALFDPRSRPLLRRARSGAPAGRQDRLRWQFPAARLEGRPRPHPHRFHGGAQARRYRAAGLRRRSGAVGRSSRRKARWRGCRPSASARS